MRRRGAREQLQDAAESASAVHEARRELGAAFQDATEVFKTGKVTAGTVLPRVVSFLQGRLQTVRQALSHFMEGYSEGLKEVCHGSVIVFNCWGRHPENRSSVVLTRSVYWGMVARL